VEGSKGGRERKREKASGWKSAIESEGR